MKKSVLILFLLSTLIGISQVREVTYLDQWKFTNTDPGNAFEEKFNDADWRTVSVPHDWAIEGEFSFAHDVQLTMVIQDGETKPRIRCGRTGALPFVGMGWYRTNINVSNTELEQKKLQLLFDGAMSNAKVYINGKHIGDRPFGYISFYYDISSYVKKGENSIAIRLENFDNQSRWYPGAGLYRKVSLIKTHKTHVKTWGTFVTTPVITKRKATVEARIEFEGSGNYTVKNEIINPKGKIVATESKTIVISEKANHKVDFELKKPQLWSLENPNMYQLKTTLLAQGKVIDNYTTPFGIRTIAFEKDAFYLNGKKVRFQGVNMHHDFGPVGAAFYKNLFERQVKKLKEMGVNAIRFSHNPPAPEALDVCDAYGILAIDEAFDEWQIGKVMNGYNNHFDKWSKTDLTDMILRDRNHPSIIMWSIGNEIMEQYKGDKNNIATYLNKIVKSLDKTRATTAGFNTIKGAIKSRMTDVVDVSGFNYKAGAYNAIIKQYPNIKFFGSETGGTTSTRNSYKFPVTFDTRHNKNGMSVEEVVYKDGQPGNYENTNVPWGYPAVKEFAALDNNPSVYGEFIWTGYDYLGEPSPYHNAQSRSSYFAPIDIVGLEKDKFYLFQTQWRKEKDVLHFLPHWTLPEMKGKTLPVVCYTSYEKAELFVNGKSYGVKTKIPNTPKFQHENLKKEGSGGSNWAQLKAYAIVWDEVTYEPGEIKIVAYNKKGKVVATEIKHTAGKPVSLKVVSETKTINKGDVGVYVVSVLDKDGNLCPGYEKSMDIKVSGAGQFMACGNGDPTNLEKFTLPKRKLFRGQAVVYVKGTANGQVKINVSSKALSGTNNDLNVE